MNTRNGVGPFRNSIAILTLAAGAVQVQADETQAPGITDSLNIHVRLEKSIQELGRLASTQEACHELARKLLAKVALADLAEQRKTCGLAETAEDQVTPGAALGKLHETLDLARAELKKIDDLYKGKVPAVPEPTPAVPSQEDLEAAKALRLISVRAGDVSHSSLSCSGSVPLQQMVLTCFGEEKEIMGSTRKFIRLSDKHLDSCFAENVTVKDLCGYDPNPDGAHEIKITYSCGGVKVSKPYFMRGEGNVAIACDGNRFTQAPHSECHKENDQKSCSSGTK